MSWIKMNRKLGETKQVRDIADITGLHELHVVGCLWKIWTWFDEHTEGGVLVTRDSRRHISRFNRDVDCDGFCEAMMAVGWMKQTDAGIELPGFTEHQGRTAKQRSQDAERQRRKRAKDAKLDPFGVTDVVTRDDRDQRREEKRREEEGESFPLTPCARAGEAPNPTRAEPIFAEPESLGNRHVSNADRSRIHKAVESLAAASGKQFSLMAVEWAVSIVGAGTSIERLESQLAAISAVLSANSHEERRYHPSLEKLLRDGGWRSDPASFDRRKRNGHANGTVPIDRSKVPSPTTAAEALQIAEKQRAIREAKKRQS
jgi:hypothetical protein